MRSSESPRILFETVPVTSPDSSGRGIGRNVRGLLEGLRQLDPPPEVTTVRFRGAPPTSNGPELVLPRRHWRGAAPWIRHLLAERAVRRLWATTSAPVWHGSDPTLFPTPLAGRSTILMMYDLIPLLMPEAYVDRFRYGNQWLWRQRLPRLWRQADAIVVNTHEVARTAGQLLGIPLERFHVVPLGVDSLDAEPVPCPVQAPFFLYVGAGDPRKNLPFLVRSFARFRSTSPGPFRLVLVGALPLSDKAHLLSIASSAGIGDELVFTGQVSDRELVSYYRHADGFLFPSLLEGFGLPPLEAMANGCPVLSSDTSCMPEVLGDSVLYADPTDEAAFAAGMSRLADDRDLARTLSASGLEHARRYTWKASAQALSGVWERCAGVPGLAAGALR